MIALFWRSIFARIYNTETDLIFYTTVLCKQRTQTTFFLVLLIANLLCLVKYSPPKDDIVKVKQL